MLLGVTAGLGAVMAVTAFFVRWHDASLSVGIGTLRFDARFSDFVDSRHVAARRPTSRAPPQDRLGGMATVFLGSLRGVLGFRRIVAIKRPHPHLLEDRGFRDALLREARLAAGSIMRTSSMCATSRWSATPSSS